MGSGGAGTFRRAFAVTEFRALWGAMAVVRAGTQLGRVALAVLAYERTGSAAVTALVYALTLVPALIGGPLLGGLADRHSRRGLIVVCGLARAALIALVAVPGIPLPVLCALIFASQLLESPAAAAQMALTPDILPKDVYQSGIAIQHLTSQIVSLAGFAAGGVLVAAVGTTGSLTINAVAFALAALIVLRGVRPHPAAGDAGAAGDGQGRRGGPLEGLRLLVSDHRLRGLLALAMLAGFQVVPEALAAPYAAGLGQGTVMVGLLMAAMPVGNVLGVFLFTRFCPTETRLRLLGPLACAASVPLLVSAVVPGPVAALLLWALVGALGAYQVTANAEFVRIVPTERRGQVLGIASSALVAVQGIGMIVGGLLATNIGVAGALGVAGAAGLAAGVPAALAWRRARAGQAPGRETLIASRPSGSLPG
ncbi:MFS transporter [Nonomuraea cavernae]|uniref:MFS transporter n=1 Tax=Nonomuraea cavernae TaxID=2045107 RepID=A0A918DPU4_9ACTN|nr:MFS transporter [Nonomuraea cavernae]MCA2189669.1 MFS transporter [Nonomuraea cavernae]GGO77482.1 MFS transporter [Nonomuraea cavernae]